MALNEDILEIFNTLDTMQSRIEKSKQDEAYSFKDKVPSSENNQTDQNHSSSYQIRTSFQKNERDKNKVNIKLNDLFIPQISDIMQKPGTSPFTN